MSPGNLLGIIPADLLDTLDKVHPCRVGTSEFSDGRGHSVLTTMPHATLRPPGLISMSALSAVLHLPFGTLKNYILDSCSLAVFKSRLEMFIFRKTFKPV